jgi:hypothetical protein
MWVKFALKRDFGPPLLILSAFIAASVCREGGSLVWKSWIRNLLLRLKKDPPKQHLRTFFGGDFPISICDHGGCFGPTPMEVHQSVTFFLEF